LENGTLPPGLSFDPTTGTISGIYTGASAAKDIALAGLNGPPLLSGGVVSNVQLLTNGPYGTGTLTLVFFLTPTGALNISTRLAVGTADDVLIGGFIITGNAPKKVIIRALGPSLESNGVPVAGRLLDPVLELHDSHGLLGSNDNWRDSQE